MRWKDYWTTPGDFHGENNSPEGITVLSVIPPGHPAELPVSALDPSTVEVRKAYPHLNDKNAEEWFEYILKNNKLPDHHPTTPEDFFDFQKFKFHTWQDADLQKEKEQMTADLIRQDRNTNGDIYVIAGVGKLAHGAEKLEIAKGNIIIVRAPDLKTNFFWVAEVIKINYSLDNNNSNNNNTPLSYFVHYYKMSKSTKLSKISKNKANINNVKQSANIVSNKAKGKGNTNFSNN